MTRISNRQIERNLKAAGYASVKVDGTLGKAEKKALAQFQGAVGVRPSGQPTAGTAQALSKVAQHARNQDSFTVGEKSKQVSAAERELNALGFKTGKVDGVLDRKSAQALKAFKNEELDLGKNRNLDRESVSALKQTASGRGRDAGAALASADPMLRGNASIEDGGTAAPGTVVTRDGLTSNSARDTDKLDARNRAARKELRANIKPERAALAAMPAEDRVRYRQVKKSLLTGRDTPAALAMQTVLLDGRLKSTATGGATAL